MAANHKNRLIPLSPLMWWIVYIDYKNVNSCTLQDHLPMCFMDQILERQDRRGRYFFLDGYSIYNQIFVTTEDEEIPIFTCLYGNFMFK